MAKVNKPGPVGNLGRTQAVQQDGNIQAQKVEKQTAGDSAVVFVRMAKDGKNQVTGSSNQDPLTTMQGLERLADRVYRLGPEGPDKDQALAVAAQVLLRAEEKMRIDPDTAKLHKRGFSSALRAQDGKQVSSKELDEAATKLIELVSQYLA